MNQPELNPGQTDSARISQLQDELYSLRTLVSVSLILLIVFGFSVNVYLFKQVRALGVQLAEAQRLSDNYNGTKVNEFWNGLVNFSRAHPDFAPVIAKYNPSLNVTLINNAAPPKK